MTKDSFISKARDAMFSIARSSLIPKTLADDLIDIYVSEKHPDQMRNGQLLTPRDWATSVMLDAARMYNVDWQPRPLP